ncbi:MAG TPA: DUF6510 family protein [Micromonosporaceae bacterium]|nr:DUF6510 family protein [Micromonosporaceae bacterium]
MADAFDTSGSAHGAFVDGAFVDGAFVDGNALGGTLREVFAVDVTAAMGRCAGCGNVDAIGTARVYARAAGAVARCVACGSVVMRVVAAPDRMFLDLRGLTFLEIPLPEGAA